MSGLIKLNLLAFCVATFSGAQAASHVLTPVNVLAANYDDQRTNANLSETTLNRFNVNSSFFGRIGTIPVDGQIYAQPLYVAGVQITGKGVHNVVYVATMHNSVYAIDADAPQSTTPLWQVNFGPSVPSSLLNFSDILPEVGVLGTPVIDPAKQVMYVVSETLESANPVFRIHALSLADGHEVMAGPAVIAGVVQINAGGNNFSPVSFDPLMHLQRPGLVLVNGIVYVCFGSHGDGGNYYGWIFGYSAANLQNRVSILNLCPKGVGASVWQSGRAPAVDSAGNLYVATGNGDFDGAVNFGQSVLKLSPGLKILDYYTPDDWADLNQSDWDLGSAGVILLGSSNTVLTGGKSGLLYLINGPMGHLSPNNTSTVQSVQANSWGAFDIAVWNKQNDSTVYLMEPYGLLKAFQIRGGKISNAVQAEYDPITQSMFAGIAVSANGSTDGTGIVWLTTGDNASRLVPGVLHALDASDISKELWNSAQVSGRDDLGRFAKFVAPTVANGYVYVPTFSNTLAIYGLLSGAGQITDPPSVTAVANGASFLTGAVSPGELLAIFGANLGPKQLTNLQMQASGHVATSLSDTQVFIDGVSAPLLYTSANQLGAVVPFGTAGPTSTVMVLSQGILSSPVTVPVLPATPALFSLDGTGGGPGAILNQDGTKNNFANPAGRGSVVVLYATGVGQTNPNGDDGMVTAAAPFPAPLLPVDVFIDNQPAEILFAGAAPGMIQGITQINARVPQSASTGDQIKVMLKVGDYSSPNTVTLSVR